MAAHKSRLGRGLGGLIANATPANKAVAEAKASAAATAPAASIAAQPAATASAPAATASAPASGFQEVPVSMVEVSPYQARKEISPEQLAGLADSIRSEGLLQPIVVRRHADKFQLIAGERRWRAFQMLKIRTIPARIVDASNASAAIIGMIENLQREGLNPMEEACGYASLIRDFDLTQDEASERVGKSRPSVANSLRLLSLDTELQGYVAKGMLSVGHAKVLLGVEDAGQRTMLARRIIEEALSVRAAEKLVQARKEAATAASGAGKGRQLNPAENAAVASIQKRLVTHLGARVALQHTPKKGKIIIEYAGNEDLQRILEKLGVEA